MILRVQRPDGTPAAGFQARVAATEATVPVRQGLDKAFGATAPLEVLLQLTDGWPLSGQVIDRDGAPVPNAEVFGWCYESGKQVFDLAGQRLMLESVWGATSEMNIRQGKTDLYGLPAERLMLDVSVFEPGGRVEYEIPIDLRAPLEGGLELVVGR